MSNTTKGQFLVAAPSLASPFFARTVILMFEHNEEGAMGVVLNRPTEATVERITEEVFDESVDWEKPIHLGGPVPGPLLVLHTQGHLADQTVLDGVYSSVERSKVEALLRANEEPCLVLANYSGWGPGQLEGEIAEDSWLVWPASQDLVFGPEPGELWDNLIARIRNAQNQAIFGVKTLESNPDWN